MKNVKRIVPAEKILWLITRTDEVGYDEYDSCVVAAKCEQNARDLAYQLWKDSSTVSVHAVGTTTLPSGIVHKSFCAG